ncbi:MAG: 1-(5-phosphoribosyl)-5-((5-phosphoribosylamino)methylideneamino)imidazole-4-carboxamide isomerase [Deltaproteobacteria bacterium]|nr:1-(5-phosphoribosyl)-5-((5-phosphoribosylamino)methylideneamino)imidazole-4-carboxamide isomerase [Deltaproteobacteria bacterium]
MLVVPAIDLRDGRAVRLVEGKADSGRVVGEDPVAIAARFFAAGAKRLHVVDLDGAFAGSPRHLALITEICRAIRIPVQVGGGLRDEASLEQVFAAGAQYAIVGTMAVEDPARFAACCARWPGRIIAGVDGKKGQVATEGWVTVRTESIIEVAQAAARAGAAAVVSTEITRDGTGHGVDVVGSASLAEAVSIPVFASGGVAGPADLEALRATKVAGVIVGRAFYDGALSLEVLA